MNILNTASLVIGILGTIGTLYFGLMSRRLSRDKKTFSWQDVERGGTYLLKRAEEEFKPEIVLMIGIEGAIVAGIALTRFTRKLPTYLAMLENKDRGRFATTTEPKGHERLETAKWIIYLPSQLAEEHDKKILIIDDRLITGTIQTGLRSFLKGKGFKPENIAFAALVCASTAITAKHEPDFYYYPHPYEEFYFPYGSWTW